MSPETTPSGFPVTVIIPALNAGPLLPETLKALKSPRKEGLPPDLIVVDGGSEDATVQVARESGARVVAASRRGRGAQLAEGAASAEREWLLFLHADTRLADGWAAEAASFIADPVNRERAGVFRFALASPDPRARRVERLVAWRCRRLGLPYGDQGLLIHRDLYAKVGGFRPLPLMEDVSLVRRIGRRRLHFFRTQAVTSAARYERGGYVRRPARNITLLILYFLGIPPRWLARLYG